LSELVLTNWGSPGFCLAHEQIGQVETLTISTDSELKHPEEFWDRDDDPSLSVRRTKAGRRTLEARLRAGDERVWAALEALATTGFDAVKLETLSEPEDDEEEDQLPVARARKVVASLGAKVTMPPAWAKALRR
jgi:hypothetical protein